MTRTHNAPDRDRLFRFKQFTLNDRDCAMKIGTDGLLLGAYAARLTSEMAPEKVLDIGTGCGIIALMVAQKCNALVTAIEPEKGAAMNARENFSASPWNDRIHFIPTTFQEFAKESAQRFDLIVCNPPYFEAFNYNKQRPDSSSKQEKPAHEMKSREIARQRISLSFNEILAGVSILLNEKGIFMVILPPAEMNAFIDMAANNGLFANNLLMIRGNPHSKIRRVIAVMGNERTEYVVIDHLTIETGKRHTYTHEYIELTKDFHPFLPD